MKIYIKALLTLIICGLFSSCKENDQSVVSPKEEVQNYLFSSGRGVLKDNFIQPYILFSEENKPIESDTNRAPDSIIDLSKKYLYKSFGEAYYNLHLKYRSSMKLSKGWFTYDKGGRYAVTYYYTITIKDFITNLIAATYHDSLGKVLSSEGVLQRLKDTTLGMPFRIDDSKAVEIARKDGFEAGYFPWHVTFQYYGSSRCYVWGINNQTGSQSGEKLIINAQTGNIIERLNWIMIMNKKRVIVLTP